MIRVDVVLDYPAFASNGLTTMKFGARVLEQVDAPARVFLVLYG